ncbi:MAG: ABC transporter ATP-binding protein [Gammaproteobacteria bacterium]
MSRDTLIEVHNLYRYYGALCAVRDVSFTVQRGEVLGFLGPNGAGKTTTMEMICGTLAPSAGALMVGGVDLLDEPKRAKQCLGYLPEHPPLYRDLTVNEYLCFCGRLHGLAGGALHRAVARACERCGLETVGRRLIGNLSKGYQQRAGIAQAILHAPAAVILDEPTVGLDPIQIREIRELIRELRAEHSVILSTHILPEVQAVCDRVLIINQGQLVLDDSLAHLAERRAGLSLRIALRQAPPLDRLLAIPGVLGIHTLDADRYLIQYHSDHDPADGLVERAVQAGWGLYELIPETHSLEETFVQLTCGDAPPARVAA